MLKNIELFSSLPKESLSTIEMFCQGRRLNAWETLFNKWEESTWMYIVNSGLLEVYDWERILWYIKPGEFVWEMALLSKDKLRTASVKAIEETQVIVLLAFSINELANKHPIILKQIQDIIEKRKKINDYL